MGRFNTLIMLAGGAATLAAFAACGGLGSMPMTPAKRVEMARGVAAQPMPTGVPPLFSSYDPGFGEASTRGSNVTGRTVHHVWVPIETQVGPVPVRSVRLGYGPPGSFDDLLLKVPLNPDHVLHEIYMEFPGGRCSELRSWLNRSYGPTPRSGRWDGITHAVHFRSTGSMTKTTYCALAWTYRFPDTNRPTNFVDGERLPPEWGHQVESEYQASYGRVWLAGAARVLRGEPVDAVLSTLDTTALDAQHRQELARHLTQLE